MELMNGIHRGISKQYNAINIMVTRLPCAMTS